MAWVGRLGDLLHLASKFAAGGFVEKRLNTALLVNASSERPFSFSYFWFRTTYNFVVPLLMKCFTLHGLCSTINKLPLREKGMR